VPIAEAGPALSGAMIRLRTAPWLPREESAGELHRPEALHLPPL